MIVINDAVFYGGSGQVKGILIGFPAFTCRFVFHPIIISFLKLVLTKDRN